MRDLRQLILYTVRWSNFATKYSREMGQQLEGIVVKVYFCFNLNIKGEIIMYLCADGNSPCIKGEIDDKIVAGPEEKASG